MSEEKKSASTVRQLEQERRRGQSGQRSQSIRNQTKGRRSKKKNSLNSWLFAGGIVVVVVAIIGTFIWLGNREKTTPVAVSSNVYTSLTNIKPDLLSQVGTGGLDGSGSSLSSLLKAVKSAPILKGPTGKPEVFYMGAEYCPYCAAQRWGMIVALNRFGSFPTAPTPLISAEDSISTFSFYKSSYQSKYIDFVSAEVQDNNQPTPNQLQTLTADQAKLVSTYDAPPYTAADGAGSFPFISVGNQYVSAGAYYSPTVIEGKTHSDIVSEIDDPTTDISRDILGSANYLTAEICALTNNQPASVCGADPIPTIQGKLPQPTASISHDNAGLANIDVPQTATVRKHGA
jgi:thiol-disulfide isomerase/thioredoxin